jgi:hypothetical protein
MSSSEQQIDRLDLETPGRFHRVGDAHPSPRRPGRAVDHQVQPGQLDLADGHPSQCPAVLALPGYQRRADGRLVLAGLQDPDAAVTGPGEEGSGQGAGARVVGQSSRLLL